MARALRGRNGVRVLTNAVNIALELNASQGPQSILTGGCMNWPGAFSLTGPTALEAIEGFVLDRAVLGITGIDVEHGATTIEMEEAAVSRSMVRQAREVIVVADSSKVGMTSRAVICGVSPPANECIIANVLIDSRRSVLWPIPRNFRIVIRYASGDLVKRINGLSVPASPSLLSSFCYHAEVPSVPR